MSSTVNLFVAQGPLAGRFFPFNERTTCIIGRGEECFPRLPDDDAHQTISRHHCLLDINPPRIRIRDMGSLNGTWVNGRRIGQRGADQTAEQARDLRFPELDLNDGDEIRLGETVFQIRTTEESSDSSAGSPKRSPHRSGQARKCLHCGADLSGDATFSQRNPLLCPGCQNNPVAVLKSLLLAANQGEAGLEALQGLKIKKNLGRGASGAAYLGQYIKTGVLVAVKLLLPEVALNESSKKMFLREVANSKHLKHPHVVQLLESGNYEGVLFYTMEFCDSGSVDKLRDKRGGKLPLKEATSIVLQALDGLDYIHNVEIPSVQLADGGVGRGRGLVHRDLKPGNIFLSRTDGRLVAKIADVGVGKAFDTAGLSGHTRTGSVAGTPVAMPRQQVINFKYAKPDVDVWAMAATYYNLLTGTYPRDFTPDRDPWLTVLQTQPIPIRQRNSSISEKLAQAIDLALVDNPEITFQSAADFKKALLDALK